MDLDCIGSIVLARYLFPGFTAVRSSRIHPVARKLYNLYEGQLDFASLPELAAQTIGTMLVVDTRSQDQVDEYLRCIKHDQLTIEIFDHHPSTDRDIPGATIHECTFGASTTQLGLELMRRRIGISREDATIALTAIYADTGNFLHPNVCPEDLEVASFLLEKGAELTLVKDFLVSLREKTQITLFHEVLNKMEAHVIRGHTVQTCYLEMVEDTQGIGAVVEKVFEVENSEIFFGFFFFTGTDRLLVIARNACEEFNANEVMSDFGGGGHKNAASATIKTAEGQTMYTKFLGYLELMLSPAVTAGDIMTREVAFLRPGMSLLEASLFLEQTSHSGAPVLDSEGKITGFLTLREIMKGRKLGKMQLPVSAFMIRDPKCIPAETLLSDVEEILYRNNIGHIPVTEDRQLAGIVTRTDFLDYLRGQDSRRKRAIESLYTAMT
jgi:tRNA nucleotidyltransferase (CCA-adding enzyme)